MNDVHQIALYTKQAGGFCIPFMGTVPLADIFLMRFDRSQLHEHRSITVDYNELPYQ